MPKFIRMGFAVSLLLACSQAYSIANTPLHFLFEGGAYYSTQGQSQNVYIATQVGDLYSVTSQHKWNDVLGLGLMMDGWQCGRITVDYGINAFYLAGTRVSGTITQEQAFTNLSFRYYVSHLPVYASARALFDTNYHHLFAVIDAGIGPNFMKTSQYSDEPLNSYTFPDNAYKGHSSVELSGTIGLGIGLHLCNVSAELDYRFFYLGRGHLVPNKSDVLNNLSTGTSYANALILTISV